MHWMYLLNGFELNNHKVFDDGHTGLRVARAGDKFIQHLRQFFAVRFVCGLNQVQVTVRLRGGRLQRCNPSGGR